MANQVTNYKCPACTGPLHFVGASGKLECDYCGSTYELKDIEKMMAEEEASATDAFEKAEEKGADPYAEELWGKGMKGYSCPSCGAELVCDDTTAATSCPYCGNPTIVPGQFSGMLKPDYIIPFKLDEKAAKDALKNHYQNKPLLPKAFSSENRINEIKGVYVPFWLFDGSVSGRANFEATKRGRVYRRGDVEITETEHYDVNREGTMEFKAVPVDASTKMPDEHMDSIEPYDYKELKEFSSVYLPGFLADKYDVSDKECEKRVDERVKNSALDELKKDVTGYQTCTVTNSSFRVNYEKHKYAMLPVYLLATKWEGTDYLFAMNGQSGKLIGDLPIDNKKYWTYLIGIFAVAAVILGTILNFMLENDSVVMKYGIGAVIALVIALIVTGNMKAKMKTARTATKAAAYIPVNGVRIEHRSDRFTHVTKSQRKLQSSNGGGGGPKR